MLSFLAEDGSQPDVLVSIPAGTGANAVAMMPIPTDTWVKEDAIVPIPADTWANAVAIVPVPVDTWAKEDAMVLIHANTCICGVLLMVLAVWGTNQSALSTRYLTYCGNLGIMPRTPIFTTVSPFKG